MKKVAAMLKRRFENIITYLRHQITNAASESINAKIQWVKYTARGFRNKQNFINAIYFHCGGLELAPSPTKYPEAPTCLLPPGDGFSSSPAASIIWSIAA
jgi:hypothetical protein